MRDRTIQDRCTFVILCNSSMKRNGQPATTDTLPLHLAQHIYFQVEKQRITYILNY